MTSEYDSNTKAYVPTDAPRDELDKAITLYGKRMREYMRSGAEEDGVGYPMKWDDELRATIEQSVVEARIDELESFYTTVPEASSEWIDERIKTLQSKGRK